MAKNPKSQQRRELARQELREQILDAAMTIFINEGYEALTIRRLADEVAYTPGALYSYFADKEALVFALVVRASEHLNGVFRALESVAHPLERLWGIGRAYIKFAMEHQAAYDLMFIMSTPIPTMIETGFKDAYAAFFILRKTVQECMEQGFLPRADADMAAYALWSFVHGSVSLMIRKRLAMIPEEKYQDLLEGAYSFLMSSMLPRHQESLTNTLTDTLPKPFPKLKKSKQSKKK
jgi:AcrR family transcriptional regulator